MQVAPHILIIDDDDKIRTLLKEFLVRNNFLCTMARDAAQARRLLTGLEFDLLVLDVMMPGENGIDLIKSLRETLATPIILLTAKAGMDERIAGLEAGADDYLTKPFEPKELILRINAILRRVTDVSAEQDTKSLTLGEITYDLLLGELRNGTRLIKLTSTESSLMRIFAANRDQAIDRLRLIGDLAKDGQAIQERAIDVQITRLRKKIEPDPKNPRYLQTVRGAGYMLAPD